MDNKKSEKKPAVKKETAKKQEEKTFNKVSPKEKKEKLYTSVKASASTLDDKDVVKGTVTIEQKTKNKYGKWIALVVAILIIALIIVGIVFFMKTPYFAVMKTFNALKGENIKALNGYIDYNTLMDSLVEGLNTGETMSDLEKNCFSEFKYKINSFKTEGDNATVTVETTNKNFRNALTKWTQTIYQRFINGNEISNEQGITILNEYLSDESIGTMSVTKDLTLKKVDGKWQLEIDDNLKDAIFPGLSEVVNSIDALTSK